LGWGFLKASGCGKFSLRGAKRASTLASRGMGTEFVGLAKVLGLVRVPVRKVAA